MTNERIWLPGMTIDPRHFILPSHLRHQRIAHLCPSRNNNSTSTYILPTFYLTHEEQFLLVPRLTRVINSFLPPPRKVLPPPIHHPVITPECKQTVNFFHVLHQRIQCNRVTSATEIWAIVMKPHWANDGCLKDIMHAHSHTRVGAYRAAGWLLSCVYNPYHPPA